MKSKNIRDNCLQRMIWEILISLLLRNWCVCNNWMFLYLLQMWFACWTGIRVELTLWRTTNICFYGQRLSFSSWVRAQQIWLGITTPVGQFLTTTTEIQVVILTGYFVWVFIWLVQVSMFKNSAHPEFDSKRHVKNIWGRTNNLFWSQRSRQRKHKSKNKEGKFNQDCKR